MRRAFLSGVVMACMVWAVLYPAPAHAAPAHAAVSVPDLAFRQHPGRTIPTVQGLRDEQARQVNLADYFGRLPVVFVLGYYHCPVLCSTLMDSVLQTLQGVDVPHEIVVLSIDPTEIPADAARKFGYYKSLMPPGQGGRLHLLTAPAAAIAAVTDAVGFPYRRAPDTGQYVHPAGYLVLTPEGRISRYLLGIGHAARDVRLALVDASGGRVGGVADRLVLLCSHYDPQTGRYSVAAMALARTAGLGTLAILLGAFWRMRRRRASEEGR